MPSLIRATKVWTPFPNLTPWVFKKFEKYWGVDPRSESRVGGAVAFSHSRFSEKLHVQRYLTNWCQDSWTYGKLIGLPKINALAQRLLKYGRPGRIHEFLRYSIIWTFTRTVHQILGRLYRHNGNPGPCFHSFILGIGCVNARNDAAFENLSSGHRLKNIRKGLWKKNSASSYFCPLIDHL